MTEAAEWRERCAKGIKAGYSPAGERASTYESGQKLAAMMREWNVWKPGDILVDVGSANGRLAMGLLHDDVVYIGLEIIPACVAFCQEAFRDLEHFHFIHMDVRNERYWKQGKIKPEEVIYPLHDGLADVVIANSLFSHTATLAVAERNLSEMRRILKPGGKLYTSWYFGDKPDADPAKTIYRRIAVSPLFAGFTITRERAQENKQTRILAVKDKAKTDA